MNELHARHTGTMLYLGSRTLLKGHTTDRAMDQLTDRWNRLK